VQQPVTLPGSGPTDPYGPELAAAVEIAERAGRLIRERAERIEEIDYKGPRDVVTDVDRRSEALILGELRRRYPEDAVLAEESGGAGSGSRTWVVDPLDGTINFANLLRLDRPRRLGGPGGGCGPRPRSGRDVQCDS
jgi:hypothetical protein